MARFYIATSLSRAKDHNTVRDHLMGMGHELTYDWTLHGSVKSTTIENLKKVADKELEGIRSADFVVVLLPGGFGTHVELGAAIAWEKRIILHSQERDVFMPCEKTNAFYHPEGIHKIVCPFPDIGCYLEAGNLFPAYP
jgi:hypothetical protein